MDLDGGCRSCPRGPTVNGTLAVGYRNDSPIIFRTSVPTDQVFTSGKYRKSPDCLEAQEFHNLGETRCPHAFYLRMIMP
jgi:hypothetical protein